jgi:hypothetical protein
MNYPYNIYGDSNASVPNNPHTSMRPHLMWTLLVLGLWWLVLSFQSLITNTHTSDLAIYMRAVAEGLATIGIFQASCRLNFV